MSEAVLAAPAKPKRINYAVATTLVAAGQSFEEIAPQVGAANANSLGVGLHRKGVTKAKVIAAIAKNAAPDLTASLTLRVAKQASELIQQKSQSTREALAEVVETQANGLKARKLPKALKTQNLHADTVQKVAKTAATVFGWGEEARPGLVVAGVLTSAGEDLESGPAIEAEVVDQAVEKQADPQP